MVRQYKQLIYSPYKETVMTMEQVQGSHTTYEIPLHKLQDIAPDVQWKNPPIITDNYTPTDVCQIVGDWYVACTSEARRHNAGQFFTPSVVACYMATMAGALDNDMHILDPGAGVGMLACALCEMALRQEVSSFSITAYEADPALHALCLFVLNYACEKLHAHGIKVHVKVHKRDFVEAMAEHFIQVSLWSQNFLPQHAFDLAILNPPYFKINQKDPRLKLVKGHVHGSTNMYTLFMSLVASALREGGGFISITPRSFASGAYFKYFRHHFFSMITPEYIHIFDSRRSTFEEADVLQENIIMAGTKKGSVSEISPVVTIARSQGLADLGTPLTQQVARNFIIDENQKDPVLHLPTSDIDTHLLQAFKRWNSTLATYGLEISTGPVVPFRSTDALVTAEEVSQGRAVPLLWLQHVRRMQITWPLPRFDKPQGISRQTDQKLLVKSTTQLVLRRFSAKEEPRRITAAVLCEGTFDTDLIGLENHLNYLYRSGGSLSYVEAIGLAAFLNSSLVDRYFRILNGNTQVSATELRQLPLPSWERITRIGERVVDMQVERDAGAIEHIIMDELETDLIVGNEEDLQLPVFNETRMNMGKIQEAQRILRDLGLPPAQQNEISALTLLAVCGLSETATWQEITANPITIHNMMGFMKSHYGRAYAENTREVVRRQVIHQFEQARLVDRNPDDPSRPTNSPITCYALTKEAYEVLQQYGTSSWEDAVATFRNNIVRYGNITSKVARPQLYH